MSCLVRGNQRFDLLFSYNFSKNGTRLRHAAHHVRRAQLLAARWCAQLSLDHGPYRPSSFAPLG
jgi:4'-phosphopantetheinyl transferase EntD